MQSVFEVVLLLGRPASGKSEFLDYMQKQPPERLCERYGLGRLAMVDDFPFLWEKFEEDDILERLGRPRIWSRLAEPSYTTTSPLIWPFLIEKINLSALKALASPALKRGEETLLIEFSRGGPTGYRDALARLDPRILVRAAILYVEVSFAESFRRNRARYDEARKSSILAHSVPEEAMHEVYATDDWPALTADGSGYLAVPSSPPGGSGADRGSSLPSPSEGEGEGEGENLHERPTTDLDEAISAHRKARQGVETPLTLTPAGQVPCPARRAQALSPAGAREWARLSAPEPAVGEGGTRGVAAQPIRVPYVTMPNEPESTDPAVLDGRYHQALATLTARYKGGA